MVKRNYPDYHKFLMEQSSYPSAIRRIKFEETPHSLIYKTGDWVYKIRKNSSLYASLAIKQAYVQEAVALGQFWSPELQPEAVALVKTADGFALGAKGELVEMALKEAQLSSHYWLNYLLENGKVTPTAMGRLARYLAAHHQAHQANEKLAADFGRPEHFRFIFEETAYQAKKYIGKAITQPMVEMIVRPVERFVDDQRKLFVKRQKKGQLVEGHGQFLPEHIYMKGKDILAISPLEGRPKYRVLDAANDVASLTNALQLMGKTELEEVFIKRYVTAAHDRELARMLPAYQAYRALAAGVALCEKASVGIPSEEEVRALHQQSNLAFALAVKRAREIPKLV